MSHNGNDISFTTNGSWAIVWEQAITRRSKLKGQGHHGLTLCMGSNQTSFLTKKNRLSEAIC
jgi:hypothetical protein